MSAAVDEGKRSFERKTSPRESSPRNGGGGGRGRQSGAGDMSGGAGGSSSSKVSDDGDDDDYGDDDDFEDVVSDGSDVAFEIADDGLVDASGSFNDSNEFLPAVNRSSGGNVSGAGRGGGSVRSSAERSTDSLNMSTSIVQDSLDMSIQGSMALDSYDFVELAQQPNPASSSRRE